MLKQTELIAPKVLIDLEKVNSFVTRHVNPYSRKEWIKYYFFYHARVIHTVCKCRLLKGNPFQNI